MDKNQAEAEMHAAHAAIGGFIARCSLLDYRVSQFMARWFCLEDKQKFLSYTLKVMPFVDKRQIIEERLTAWHSDPSALRQTMAEIAAVTERRNLVASGLLSKTSSGRFCIKSFSGARIISEEGAVDIVNVSDLSSWSEKASDLAERLLSLSKSLQNSVK
jgi:hypothetical protein